MQENYISLPEKTIEVGVDDLCRCKNSEKCPLGKKGPGKRCTYMELIDYKSSHYGLDILTGAEIHYKYGPFNTKPLRTMAIWLILVFIALYLWNHHA